VGTLVRELWLPRAPDDVFQFFADAFNLEAITPPWPRFRILTPAPIEMREGTQIEYRLRFRRVPVRWRSEITAWDPPDRFVDEQRRGPYRHWIHEHTFEGRDGGTLVRDHVDYAVAGGELLERAFVARDLDRIFDYRSATLRELLEA
jgi:ligand-binding SRPBCC domain-containing protein